jgi:hypothetical protein
MLVGKPPVVAWDLNSAPSALGKGDGGPDLGMLLNYNSAAWIDQMVLFDPYKVDIICTIIGGSFVTLRP